MESIQIIKNPNYMDPKNLHTTQFLHFKASLGEIKKILDNNNSTINNILKALLRKTGRSPKSHHLKENKDRGL